MPQSLAKVYVHIVFTTKHGKPLISAEIRNELHAYMVGTISKLGSYANEIYANPNHIHILCNLPRTMTIAEFVSKIKTSSSKWMKTKGKHSFSWQDGYGIFSVSSSKIDVVGKYIRNQPRHHEKLTFRDELRKFFEEYDIDYDEKYIWD